MISFTDLLKEGYKSLEGVNEATIQNIDAGRQLANLTKTSFGPNGKAGRLCRNATLTVRRNE